MSGFHMFLFLGAIWFVYSFVYIGCMISRRAKLDWQMSHMARTFALTNHRQMESQFPGSTKMADVEVQEGNPFVVSHKHLDNVCIQFFFCFLPDLFYTMLLSSPATVDEFEVSQYKSETTTEEI
ncbi:uncharacterized protein MJAP1_003614 [Malassezia japonica]|uniref:Uncharacterized protein n=1 Tax=Malassezia japonica TaxID=223818 RepID=A0AAF0F0N5_9BASI|nr:uncharacterized protein MJAP1_003614 [Malassezia japonica]WFD40626.1 hypothetical protein MJAP1_003614 [Malassezia japonica]